MKFFGLDSLMVGCNSFKSYVIRLKANKISYLFMERMLGMTIDMEGDVFLAKECLFDVIALVDEKNHPCVIKK